ncbi:MBL fold metallo-hydrolase [Sabulicella glaciei]|uniref:MBL fold metallo-hydrolase n=1 Tax=Sabulicella glaciei TaxID=2984948 RepID=A0ABT3NXG6_9PROT|nr:MBL fold metallo-hydrolase [Roseococcus sp. MDT2-1-1]MCW8086861.1 MBL fold metallo-hydrolase [Roseococcus sp. MDT2-1-1]
MPEAAIRAFFHEPTNTVSYLVWCPDTREGAVVDPVLDWNQAAGEASTRSAQAILDAAREEGVRIARILETHAHADHLTAAPWLKARTGALIGIGARITEVQRIFRPVFDVEADPGDFDELYEDGDHFALGHLRVEVLHVPGHTPADIAYKVGDDVFVGDTLFMHDYGTARCDFPGGDCRALWGSIARLLALPDHTRLWMCHDYKAPGRDRFAWQSSVAEQKAHNPHLKLGEEEFVRFRQERDAKLSPPALLIPSIQVNIRAGRFPEAEANGVRYLKLPVKGTVE